MEKKIHEGHRKRVKSRFIAEGLDHFEDHEVLELLLFYCIPMKDTNELAHKMIREFGSLAGIFEAERKYSHPPITHSTCLPKIYSRKMEHQDHTKQFFISWGICYFTFRW